MYGLIRSKRKTIGIYITKNATLEVRAPLKTPKADIDKFIKSKEKWITKHLSAGQIRNEQKAGFKLDYGSKVLLRGKEYPINVKAGNKVGFDEQCFYMPANLNNEEIKYAVIQIYKLMAKNILTKKVLFFSNIMGLSPFAVKINGAKTRWGSCSGKNSLNFSWRLALASDDVIDYVTVHELAHIKEHNHSDRFWRVVASVLPDYKKSQQKLKLLQEKFCKENWE